MSISRKNYIVNQIGNIPVIPDASPLSDLIADERSFGALVIPSAPDGN